MFFEGIGIMVVGGFMVYASWKDYNYNKIFKSCSHRVDKIKTIKIAKNSQRSQIIK